MRLPKTSALVAALLAAGCSLIGQDDHKCPKPTVYDQPTLDKIQAEIDKLPRDSILRQVLADYENERDDLRFCR
jgi:hypothetical protein